MSAVEIMKETFLPKTSTDKDFSDTNSTEEQSYKTFPAQSVLRKLLDDRYDAGLNHSITKGIQATVTRPETRHHMIDLHGLAMFLRRATRCMQCFETGSLSMMGNISRQQQPPSVTKITLTCQNCHFTLGQDLKKPKLAQSVLESSKPVEQEGSSTSSSKPCPAFPSASYKSHPTIPTSSSPLEEVWIQEEQDDKEPPEKKARLSNHDPLSVSNKLKDKLSLVQKIIVPPPRRADPELAPSGSYVHSLDFPKPKLNIYWRPSKNSDNSSYEFSLINDRNNSKEEEESPTPPSTFSSLTEPSSTNQSKRSHSLEDVNSLNLGRALVGPSENSSTQCIKEENNSNEFFMQQGTSTNPSTLPTNLTSKFRNSMETNSCFDLDSQNKFSTSRHHAPSIRNSFVSKVLDDFENISDITCSERMKNIDKTINIERKDIDSNDIDAPKPNTLSEETGMPSRDSTSMETPAAGNSNSSNAKIHSDNSLNFKCPSVYTSNQYHLRDSRIITKLISLTEALKSELVNRAKEIQENSAEQLLEKEGQNILHSKEISESMKMSIKKEPEECSEELKEQSNLLFEKTPNANLGQTEYKIDKDPELIIPDVFIKSLKEPDRVNQMESANANSTDTKENELIHSKPFALLKADEVKKEEEETDEVHSMSTDTVTKPMTSVFF